MGGGGGRLGNCQPQIARLHGNMATVFFSGVLARTAKQSLSAPSCLSVRTCSTAYGGQIFAKSDIGRGAVMKICPAIPSLVKIEQKYRPYCAKT